jgi:hypothetical protein
MRFLVLDLTPVQDLGSTALNTFKEVLGLGKEECFQVIFSGVHSDVLEELNRFGIVTDTILNHESPKKVAGMTPEYARFGTFPPMHIQKTGLCSAKPLKVALEFCEERIIQEYQTAQESSNFHTCPWYQSHAEAKKDLVSEAGLSCDHPAFPVLVDVHWWLKRFCSSHDTKMVSELWKYLEAHTYNDGEMVYSFRSDDHNKHRMYLSTPDCPVPPLIWLAGGEIEHKWTGEDQPNHKLKFGTRLEKAAARSNDVFDCIGPLQTVFGFQGGTPHPGELIAVDKAHVVLLRREQYLEFRRRSPDAAALFDIYLAKKQHFDSNIDCKNLLSKVYHRCLQASNVPGLGLRDSKGVDFMSFKAQVSE